LWFLPERTHTKLSFFSQFKDSALINSETKYILLSIFYLDIPRPIFRYGDKNMLATSKVEEASIRRGADKSLAFPIFFLFPTQSKEFFLDALKKLEQRSHKCVCGAQEGICRVNIIFQSRSLLFSL
jgi:hypothetical protein